MNNTRKKTLHTIIFCLVALGAGILSALLPYHWKNSTGAASPQIIRSSAPFWLDDQR